MLSLFFYVHETVTDVFVIKPVSSLALFSNNNSNKTYLALSWTACLAGEWSELPGCTNYQWGANALCEITNRPLLKLCLLNMYRFFNFLKFIDKLEIL